MSFQTKMKFLAGVWDENESRQSNKNIYWNKKLLNENKKWICKQ